MTIGMLSFFLIPEEKIIQSFFDIWEANWCETKIL